MKAARAGRCSADAAAGRPTQGQAQYLGRYGQLTGLAQDLGGRTQAAVQASGALVLMDGVVTPSRRINDSFALVSTGAPDVDVLHENRKLGKTDSSGHLLVPDLIPYQANRVSIDVENLPVDTRLESTKAVVVPQSRSGVVANFQLERYVAATVILKTPDGQFLPPGAGVLHAESGKRGVVGYDGMTFVEDLQALNHLTVQGKGVSCRAQFEYGAERTPDAHAGPLCLPSFGGTCAMRRAIVLIVLAWCWAWSGAAQAQSCDLTGSSTTIDFGTINPLLPADTLNNGGLIKLNCSGLSLFTRVCISLGTGNTSPSIAARAMGNGSYRMNYNLYTDPGYSNIWGNATTSAPTSQLLTGIGAGSVSATVYAKLPGGRTP